jgi:hypothetical protein
MINCHTTPIFVENSHEWPFSTISKANTYGFLTKKWYPPEYQECDLWQEKICGVRWTILWSMINGHKTPIFVENSHERPFSIIPKANTYGFFYEEMVSTRNPWMWSMSMKHMWGEVYEPLVNDQWPHNPHFLSKIAWTTIFNYQWLFPTKMGVVLPLIIDQRLVHLTPHMFPSHRSHSWISSRDHFLVKNL